MTYLQRAAWLILPTFVPGLCSHLACRCVMSASVEPYRLDGVWREPLIYRDLVDYELRITRACWPADVPRQKYGPFNGATHLCLPLKGGGL